MHIQKCLIIVAALTMGGAAVATAPNAVFSIEEGLQQPQPQQPQSEEVRRQLEEQRRRLMERLQGELQNQQQPPPRGQPTQTPFGQIPAPGATSPVPATPLPDPIPRPALTGGQVQLSYDNAELYDFINQMASTLGISPIIIDPAVKGSVTIHSSSPMPKEDVWPLFNIVLKNNNAALVQQGNIYQIVPISDALKKGLEIVEHLPPPSPEAKTTPEAPTQTPPPGPQTPPGNQAPPQPAPPQPAPPQPVTPAADSRVPRLSTHVIRAEFVPVRDLLDPIKLFMTDGGVIMPYDRLNMLIITDYADSVQKIIEIIRLLDDSFLDPDLVDLIKIKYNASADVVEDLRKIFGSGAKDSATGINFISLDRMNAILVIANSKRAMSEVKNWIGKLDATTGRVLQTFVYTVENSTAANIAMILGSLYDGEGGAGTSGTTDTQGGVQGGAGRTTTPFGGRGGSTGTTGTPFGSVGGGGTGGFGQGGFGQGGFGQGGFGQGGFGQGGYQGGGGFGGGGVFGGGQQLGPRLSQGPGMYAQVLRGGALTGLQDTVRLVVDEINNALIIQASAADYAYLEELIKKLDVLPRQVIIDARIFEVELTDDFQFGVAAALQARAAGPNVTTSKLEQGTGRITANTFALIGNMREVLIAIDALREKTKVKILEAPSVLALDGTEAKIVVGGEIPYSSGSIISGGISPGFSSIQYRETGVSLIVIPRISASGTVTLMIAQEVSTLGALVGDNPSFNKASVSTTLAVQDGETVAIAGLIRDSDTSGRQGIPWLSEIPLIGALFGTTRRTVNRTELLILITPHVIRTPDRFQEMTEDLKDSLRHVRKLVDQKDEERLDDMEDARKEKYRREEKRRKGSESPPANKP